MGVEAAGYMSFFCFAATSVPTRCLFPVFTDARPAKVKTKKKRKKEIKETVKT